ncbi:MAG: ABC transporter ATP-binding protein [Vicinamibacterales bacterium]
MDFTSLSFADVSRSYGRRWALSRVSLRCEAGEIVGILGSNGAGKATLLAIAAGLLSPSAGRVHYGDLDARPGAPLRQCIGLVGHDLYLYPELTAAENLTFYARLHGISDVAARVDRALERAQLTARRDDQVLGFSRGMRQRLTLERAMLHAPRLVLLDEPFTGLDDASALSLVARLEDLRASGCIVLIATHDLEIVDGLLTRAVMLREGKLAALPPLGGSLRERYRRAGA